MSLVALRVESRQKSTIAYRVVPCDTDNTIRESNDDEGPTMCNREQDGNRSHITGSSTTSIPTFYHLPNLSEKTKGRPGAAHDSFIICFNLLHPLPRPATLTTKPCSNSKPELVGAWEC